MYYYSKVIKALSIVNPTAQKHNWHENTFHTTYVYFDIYHAIAHAVPYETMTAMTACGLVGTVGTIKAYMNHVTAPEIE